MNFAQLLGPVVGGAICQAGGFYLPFLAMGAFQILMAFVTIFCLPHLEQGLSPVNSVAAAKKISIVKMLRIPTIWFSFTSFIVATMCNGFLSINLEPKVLRPLHLNSFYIGVLFGLKDGANCLSTPLWGYLCDKKRDNSVKHYLVV